ncbi:hypothetical protein FOA52_004786 [Chlamydomonas sp. UWO 241]|nr:hypothetical protein FOA52_004786 [Chlamydomonas sp. UWO 241]
MFDSPIELVLLLVLGMVSGRLISWAFPHDTTLLPGLPLLGNVIGLGRHGVAYISAARRKFGDAFTLNLCGKYMTFLCDPLLVETFFRAPDADISFRPAVEQFTARVFGLPSSEFFPKHAQLLKDLRHLLVPAELEAHVQSLSSKVHALSSGALPEGQTVELYGAVRTLVFQSAIESLFGPQLAASVPGGAPALQERFFEFEGGFEVGATPLPHALQPSFSSSRADLLKWLGAAHQSDGFGDTTAGRLVASAGLRPALAPNMLLAVLWASQANTVPATFWTTAMLLLPEHAKHAHRVVEELGAELSSAAGGGRKGATAAASLTQEQLAVAAFRLSMDRKSCISRCVAEAVRLRVHSIDLRITSRAIELTDSKGGKLSLPSGRLLAVCPFDFHHDDAMYPPCASDFDPDRTPLTLGDGSAVVSSVAGLAFGGGSYRCPGRFFAEMEVALIVQLLLWCYSLRLVSEGDSAPGRAEGQPQGAGGMDNGEGGWVGPVGVGARAVLGDDAAVWGLGLLQRQQGQGGAVGGAGPSGDGSSGSGTPSLPTWRASGDPSSLLPRADLHRLVGVKLPAELCMVTVTRREP